MSFHEPVERRARRAGETSRRPTMFCSSTPTRFVPFATFAGRPSRISSGSVSSEPLPASVLMKPAMKPVTGTAASSSGCGSSMRVDAAGRGKARRTLATT